MQPDPIAIELSRALKSARVREALAPALARVQSALAALPGQPQAWEPLPLESLELAVPPEIQSCWIFVLRAGAIFGAERTARFDNMAVSAWLPRICLEFGYFVYRLR